MAKQATPRSLWTGSITFGLVNVPIRLYPAVREHNISFHLLHDQDHARLRRKMVCSVDGKEVHSEHMVRGFEIAPDQYIVIRDEELEAIQPQKRKTIEIEDFVDLDEIDPVYFDRSYYLAPQEAGARAYRLLVDAMTKSHKVGIARFVMHSKEYLAALRPVEGVLHLETMHFGDEVLPPETVHSPSAAAKTKPDDREVKVAQQLIESLSASFDPGKYRDDYREAIEEMIERRAAGEKFVVAPQPAQAPARTSNLMAALEASLAKAKQEAKGGATATRAASSRASKSHPGDSRRRKKSA